MKFVVHCSLLIICLFKCIHTIPQNNRLFSSSSNFNLVLPSSTYTYDSAERYNIASQLGHYPNSTHFPVVAMPLCPPFGEEVDTVTQEKFLAILMHSCRYDKLTEPQAEKPLNISVHLDIKHLDASEHQQIQMYVFIKYQYTDNRLKYDKLSPRRHLIVGEDALKNKIWLPHILLVHEKRSLIVNEEGKDILVTINPQGEVTFSCQINTVIYCSMNLKKFPFDTQRCNVSFRSWIYNDSSVGLNWNEDHPVQLSKKLHLTQFSLVEYFTYSHSVEEPSFEIIGNYSTITLEFVLSREIGYYMLDYFIPSCLLVAATWGTFWLQADAAPARTALGTSPMLAFITLGQGLNKTLPKVSYVKASDIWFLMCAVFIFSSMVEFFFVNIIWRRKKHVDVKKVNSKYILKSTITPRLARKELEMSNLSINRQANKETDALYTTYLTVQDAVDNRSLSPSRNSQNEDDIDQELTIPIPTLDYDQKQPEKVHQWTSMTPQEVSMWIDRRSRVVFPCAFFVCNILYWSFVYVF